MLDGRWVCFTGRRGSGMTGCVCVCMYDVIMLVHQGRDVGRMSAVLGVGMALEY